MCSMHLNVHCITRLHPNVQLIKALMIQKIEPVKRDAHHLFLRPKTCSQSSSQSLVSLNLVLLPATLLVHKLLQLNTATGILLAQLQHEAMNDRFNLPSMARLSHQWERMLDRQSFYSALPTSRHLNTRSSSTRHKASGNTTVNLSFTDIAEPAVPVLQRTFAVSYR